MPKPVKIVLALALLIGGADAARDYFTAANEPGSPDRIGEIVSFWSFVAFSLCLGGWLAYRRLRSRK